MTYLHLGFGSSLQSVRPIDNSFKMLARGNCKGQLCICCLMVTISPSSCTMADDIQGTPPVLAWSQFIKPLPELGRRLRIAAPCVGIHGSGHACQQMSVDFDSVNVFDLQKSYFPYLQDLLLSHGMHKNNIILNLGKTAGDLLRVPLQDLQGPVDFLICGPPCPPWAGQGKKKSTKDPRAKVFYRILEWVVWMIHNFGLLGVIIENVKGLLAEFDENESAKAKFMRVLITHCPSFDWSCDVLQLEDYLCPSRRCRVFIRGINKQICPSIPPCLPAWGKRHISEILGNFVNTPRNSLTLAQQRNLIYYESEIIRRVRDGRLSVDDIVVFSIDRAGSFL